MGQRDQVARLLGGGDPGDQAIPSVPFFTPPSLTAAIVSFFRKTLAHATAVRWVGSLPSTIGPSAFIEVIEGHACPPSRWIDSPLRRPE